MSIRAFRFSAALVFALSFMTLASGQRPGTNDLHEMEQYTLTMDNVTRYMETLKELKPMMDGNPELQDIITIDANRDKSLDELAARITTHPEVAAIVTKHGFTARQFFLEDTCLIQASIGSAMKPATQSDAEYGKATHINPANLAFVRDHQAELRALGAGRHRRSSD